MVRRVQQDHVVGVWVGNFDATPIHGLAGVSGAGPVFRSIMLRLRTRGSRPWAAAPPPGWERAPVCALSGDTPTPACTATVLEWFRPGEYATRARCAFHRREHDGTTLRLAGGVSRLGGTAGHAG